ncbi:MAG: redoxin domain-containing protein [Phycisphaerales bacterium]|nr:redoxin domain-containing protein [Phycisphaerales bacterium]
MLNRLTGWALGASVSLALVCPAALAADLVVGDSAPRLEHVNWLQGEPVKEWTPGQIYVLDFWATWCGPCIATIPHMNEMHNALKDKGVHVIGVAVWTDPDSEPTADFVREQGEDMAYPIAEDVGEQTALNFMEASGQDGIPTVMVINGEGKLAWIGHPLDGLDDVVEKVRAGEWDLEAAAAKHRAEMEEKAREREAMAAAREKLMPIMERLQGAGMAGDWDGFVVAIDEVLGMEPELLEAAGLPRTQMMFARGRVMIEPDKMNDPAKGYAYLASVVDGAAKDDGYALNEIAWWIVDDEALEKRDLDLALRAAERANELGMGKIPPVLDTLARVHFLRGDLEKAIDVQTQAVEITDEPEFKAMLQETLEEYKAAAAKR